MNLVHLELRETRWRYRELQNSLDISIYLSNVIIISSNIFNKSNYIQNEIPFNVKNLTHNPKIQGWVEGRNCILWQLWEGLKRIFLGQSVHLNTSQGVTVRNISAHPHLTHQGGLCGVYRVCTVSRSSLTGCTSPQSDNYNSMAYGILLLNNYRPLRSVRRNEGLRRAESLSWSAASLLWNEFSK